MRNLDCEPNTFVGPVDPRVVERLNERYPLDPDFLACMERCHGGVPRVGVFTIAGQRCRIGGFLTLFDTKSELPPPFRPHFDDASMDERVVNGICYLKDYEHATSRALFRDLLPFAAMQIGMCLDRAYVDLLCFDYRTRGGKPAVVLWNADPANAAYMTREELPPDEAFDEEENMRGVPWDNFLTPVAADFASFVSMLHA